MTETDLTKNADDASRGSEASFLQRKLPYIAVLTPAVLGVAYTNISHQPLVRYWEFLALATGVLCVITEWENAKGRQARLRLMWTQALHWGGHDEYRAAIPCSANATHASDTSGASEIARAWHVSRWRQFSVLANLLSGTGDGARRSGDRVVQTIRPVLVSGRNISGWTCHGILAAPDGQTLYRLAAMRPYERLCVVGPDRRQATSSDAPGGLRRSLARRR